MRLFTGTGVSLLSSFQEGNIATAWNESGIKFLDLASRSSGIGSQKGQTNGKRIREVLFRKKTRGVLLCPHFTHIDLASFKGICRADIQAGITGYERPEAIVVRVTKSVQVGRIPVHPVTAHPHIRAAQEC